MGPYRLQQILDYWRGEAHHRAPLGALAVEDGVREIAHYEQLEVLRVTVTPKEHHYLSVAIEYRLKEELDGKPVRARWCLFDVRNPNVTGPWPAMLKCILRWQASTPPHLRGLPHNADEATTQKATDLVKQKTGYAGLAVGDLWVRVCDGSEYAVGGPFSPPPHVRPAGVRPGTVTFGHLTRCGEVAMRKYRQVEGLDGQAAHAEAGRPA